MCRDAQFVFFSRNRFVVHDLSALMPWWVPGEGHYPYDRLFASEFLRGMVPVHCLADLRFLELVFPPYGPDGWPNNVEGRAAALDWRDTLHCVRGRVNAPALTVSVVMADFHSYPNDVHEGLTKEQGIQIFKGYSVVLEFLRTLVRDDDDYDGLRGIHVQVAYPWRWTVGNRQRLHGWWAREEQRLSEYAEAFVLQGRVPRGNGAELRRSAWQRWYEVDESYCYKYCQREEELSE
jgi:hypothetical protein